MLMLNWPSWEERRKGGEGRIEDGRPSQAKNAIAPVVRAGRPLCLDKTGSGDTQDEPRDHWHLLADRLVARARREVPGPTGRRLPIPRPDFRYPGAFSGCHPFLLPRSLPHPSSRMPYTPLPGPVCRFPGLTPGLFFFSAPPRPLPGQRAQKFHLQYPFPTLNPILDLVVGLSLSQQLRAGGRCPFFLGGGESITLRMESAASAGRQAIGNGYQAASPSTQTLIFFPSFS